MYLLMHAGLGSSWAQPHVSKIDSLKSVLARLQQDTTYVRVANTIAGHYQETSRLDSLKWYAERARTVALRLGDEVGEINATLHLASYYYSSSQTQEAYRLTRHVLALAQDFSSAQGTALRTLGLVKTREGDYDSARHFLDRALSVFLKTKNVTGQASVKYSIGWLHDLRAEHNPALECYLESIKLYEGCGDFYNASFSYQALGELFRKQRQYHKALRYLHKQIQYYSKIGDQHGYSYAATGLGMVYQDLRQFDSALYYHKQALEINQKQRNTYLVGVSMNNIGDVYRAKGDLTAAVPYYQSSLDICRKIGDAEGEIYPLDGLGYIYTRQGHYAEADKYLTLAREQATRLHIPMLLVDIYLHTAQLDSARHNYAQAYAWYKQYADMEDSVVVKAQSEKILELQTRFESQKKDQEIAYLNQEKEFKEGQRQKERNLMAGFLLLSMLFILALLYIIYQKARTSRLLERQNAEIEHKNSELNQINEEVNAVLETVEAQNRNLADKNEKLEELNREKDALIGFVAHDLRSPLTKTQGLVDLIPLSGPTNPAQDELLGLIHKVCEDGNVLIKELLEIHSLENGERELELDAFDLSRFITELIRDYVPIAAEKNITLHEESISTTVKAVYSHQDYLRRILDNLLSNAIKFSPAGKRVNVISEIQADRFVIRVQDEGPGIRDQERIHLFKKFRKLSAKPTAGEPSTGLGLAIVKALADQLGAHLEVESVWREGTTFILSVPQPRR